MTNFQPVRMLALPFFAQEEVVKCMEIDAVYTLHSLSRRISRVVKATMCLMKKSRIDVRYGFYNFDIYLRGGPYSSKYSHFDTDRVTEHTYNYTKSVLKFLANGLNISNISLYYYFENDMFFTPELMTNDLLPFISGLQLKFSQISVEFDSMSPIMDEAIKETLKTFRNATKLIMLANPTRPFQLNPVELGEMHLETLILNTSSWVTVDHVLNCFMTCKVVKLREEILDPLRFPLIVEKWKKGSRLEELSIDFDINAYPIREIFPNIPEEQAERAVLLRRRNRNEVNLFAIRQENGKEAVVVLQPSRFKSAKLVISTNLGNAQ